VDVNNACLLVKDLVIYCTPIALIINLTQFGANAILSAITGRGLRLNGR
jgi:hypothetical protein